jgi:predicted dehydrogenase
MTRNDFSRRRFLGLGLAAAGGAIAAKTILLDPDPLYAMPQTVAPSDRLRMGIIGIGMQGNWLLSSAIDLPGIECVAACDLYDGRHTLAREITNKPELPATRRYHELLENKNIDCLIAAVPDHWHKQIVVDACAAGKDIYCEKPMSHSAAEGVDFVEAQKKYNRIVQIGSQRVSSQICKKAKEIVESGALGDLMLVEGWLGRNDPTGAWEYPPPFDLSPQTLDWDTWLGTAPKHAFSPEIFARWRCWKEYGTGVAGDLLVHLVSGMMFVLGWNEPPKRAMAMGGILRWKDGRNMPDVHASLFQYGEIPVYMRLNLGTEMPEVYRFQGSKGILEMTEFGLSFTPQAGVDTAPSYYDGSFPRAMKAQYEKEWREKHAVPIGKDPMPETITYKGPDYDDVKPHLWNFFQSVKSRKPVVEDALFGHHAALACHMANESYFRQAAVTWDPTTKTIKS